MDREVGNNQDLLVFDLNCATDRYNLLLSVLLKKEKDLDGTSLFSNGCKV